MLKRTNRATAQPESQPSFTDTLHPFDRPASERVPTELELLAACERHLRALTRADSGIANWYQDFIDLAANVPQRLPDRPGRKSLSCFVQPASTVFVAPSAVYFGMDSSVNALRGMPIPVGGEREFSHESEMWFVSATATRLVYSEEWE